MKIFFALALLFCTSAMAEKIQKSEFSIDVPKSWNEIPQSVLTKSFDDVQRALPNSTYPKQNYGFQIGKTWLSYPYLMIEIKASRKYSLSELRSAGKIDMQKISAQSKEQLGEWMNNIKLGQPMFDENTNITWVFLNGKVANIGDVAGVLGMIPTENGFIQVTGSSKVGDFSKNLPIFQKIILSIKVKSPLVYQ
jgi:hypothetical protein